MLQEADDVSRQFCAIGRLVVGLAAATVSSHVHGDHLKVRRQNPNNLCPVPALERLAEAVDENHGRTLSPHLISRPGPVGIEEMILRALALCALRTDQARPDGYQRA